MYHTCSTIPALDQSLIWGHIFLSLIMRSILLLSLLTLFGVPSWGSELGNVVAEFQKPTVGNAKSVLTELDRLIANGNARTVTLSKKVHRSVKRIFTLEYRIHTAQKEAAGKEARAKQLEKNAKEWLKPNVHGQVNRNAADVGLRRAMTLRSEAADLRAEFSKEWAEETAGFEKMLGDLEFSKEWGSLKTLGGVLQALVKRMPWVARPTLKYSEARILFLEDWLKNKEGWETLARHAAEAGDLDLAYDLYRKAGNLSAMAQIGGRLASDLEVQKFPGSALNVWECLGQTTKAEALRARHPVLTAASFRVLPPPSLHRRVAPACVRILTRAGPRTGFFYKSGGYLLTSKSGLKDERGKLSPLTVLLENGKKLPAQIIATSDQHDLIALRIDLSDHEVLPLSNGGELAAGSKLTLSGFSKPQENTPQFAQGTVMIPLELWKEQPTIRLALDASAGCRGGPFLDSRGRVVGLLMSSQTGTARSLEAGVIAAFVKGL